MSRTSEFLSGVRAELPLQLGVVPFGMIYGVLAVKAGLSPLTAQLSSAVVFAGSAQLAIAQMLSSGAAAPVTALTAMVLNVRHVLYSASAAPHVRHLPARWRVLLAYLLTDEAYAVAIGRYMGRERASSPDFTAAPSSGDHEASPPRCEMMSGALRRLERGEISPPAPPSRASAQLGTDLRHWFFFGAGVTLWACWQASTGLGVLFGAQLSPKWELDFAIPLTFIALIIPSLSDRLNVIAALVGAGASVLLVTMPLKLGLFGAILLGIAAAVVAERLVGEAR